MTTPRTSEFSPTDEKLIEFITHHIEDEKALTEYFSRLTRPLTANILTLKFSSKEGIIHNFLAYAAGKQGAAYFKYLVALATPEAAIAATSEEAVNETSPPPLLRILGNEAEYKLEESVLQLLEKISDQSLGKASVDEFKSMNGLMIVLTRSTEKVVESFLRKVPTEEINAAARKQLRGLTLLFLVPSNVIKLTPALLEIFLGRLSDETKDFLISTPCLGKNVLDILLEKTYTNKENIIHILFKNLGDKITHKIVSKKFGQVDFFHYLLSMFQQGYISLSLIDAILSPINQQILDTVAMSTTKDGFTSLFSLTNSFIGKNLLNLPSIDINHNKAPEVIAVEHIIKFLSSKTIIAFIEQPFDYWKTKEPGKKITQDELKELDNTSGIYLESLGEHSASLLNQILRTVLAANYPLNLTPATLYRLNTENLSRYLMQHPEIKPDELQKQKAHHPIINWKYRPDFEARLKEAENHAFIDVIFFLSVYECLLNHFFPTTLALLMVEYMEKEPIVESRMLYEIQQETNSRKISEMKSTYRILENFFPHMQSLIFKKKEAEIVMSYLSEHPYLEKMTVSTLEKEKTALQETKSFFTKMKKILPTTSKLSKELLPHTKKINTAQKAVSDFVKLTTLKIEKKIDDVASMSVIPKTIQDFKKFYEKKQDQDQLDKIALLEKNIRTANQEYLEASIKLLLNMWDENPTKKSASAQKLQTEARAFGYDCKDMKQDGNCFFHAIVDQLALQQLSCLGRNHDELRVIAINHMLDHLDEYKDFLDEHDGSMQQFMSHNLEPGIWADHLIISALANALSVNIVIIRSDGAIPNLFLQKNPATTLTIGHEVGHHYQSLIENKSLNKTKSLAPYFTEASSQVILTEEKSNEIIAASLSALQKNKCDTPLTRAIVKASPLDAKALGFIILPLLHSKKLATDKVLLALLKNAHYGNKLIDTFVLQLQHSPLCNEHNIERLITYGCYADWFQNLLQCLIKQKLDSQENYDWLLAHVANDHFRTVLTQLTKEAIIDQETLKALKSLNQNLLAKVFDIISTQEKLTKQQLLEAVRSVVSPIIRNKLSTTISTFFKAHPGGDMPEPVIQIIGSYCI